MDIDRLGTVWTHAFSHDFKAEGLKIEGGPVLFQDAVYVILSDACIQVVFRYKGLGSQLDALGLNAGVSYYSGIISGFTSDGDLEREYIGKTASFFGGVSVPIGLRTTKFSQRI